MITISYKGLRSSLKGKALWLITCLTLPWIVWRERNVRIFEEKWRTFEMLKDSLHFYSSFWASCIVAFIGALLDVI